MTIDPSRATGAYAAVTTLAMAWLALGAAMPGQDARLRTLDVERINIREPDGTLRLVITSGARTPGIVLGKREIPHPTRHDAGILFYNEEGIENGGLVISGKMKDGKRQNDGSLTFDRYLQDQTVQLFSSEDGAERQAGVRVIDRPDAPMDFDAAARVAAMPRGLARDTAIRAAHFDSAQRAFLGRDADGASRLQLRDAAGRVRIALEVAADGAAALKFVDASGVTTRTIAAPR